MNESPPPSRSSNIEPLARAICERDLRRAGTAEISLAADVDRYWHCVAAKIEAGLIDDNEQIIPHELAAGLTAYRDWCERH
ncbi:MAG: hypothetical protein ACLPPF_10465 [Rhodomicrobium sp.]